MKIKSKTELIPSEVEAVSATCEIFFHWLGRWAKHRKEKGVSE